VGFEGLGQPSGEEVLVALGLVVAFYMAWNLGANDAANPTNTAVGSGALSLRSAILLFSLFAALGALLQGYRVIKTIGKGVVKDLDPAMALAASLGAGLWVTLATRKGLPVSTTHSAVGAVVGVGLTRAAVLHVEGKIDWSVVGKVVLSWVTSPLGALALAAILYYPLLALYRLLEGRGHDPAPLYRAMLVGALAFGAYAYGTNDVANATGVYVNVVGPVLGTPDAATMRLLALLGAVGIALGAFTWGYRVISTVGFKITRLDYITGTAAELASASVVYLFSLLGMPISTTHASVSAVIGVGIARDKSVRGVDGWTVLVIIAGWLLTLPAAAGFASALYLLIIHLV
jgi:PiT family inorganic phosphate transporter